MIFSFPISPHRTTPTQQYLGSTVVKELRGTESTRKSIQKLKQDAQHSTATNMLMSSQSETNAARNQSFNKQKRILVALAISHHGVEFLDVNTKVRNVQIA